jgi:hypothetical protein
MDADADVDPDTHPDNVEKEERTWDIVLESSTERFLISPCSVNGQDERDDAEKTVDPPRRYKLSRIVEGGPPISPDPAANGDDKPSIKPVDPPVDAKPSPPTWSTPPAESDRTPTSTQNKGRSLTPTKAASQPPLTKALARVLSSDIGQEHIHFSDDGISVEGLDASLGLKEISARRWRRASPDEFIIT